MSHRHLASRPAASGAAPFASQACATFEAYGARFELRAPDPFTLERACEFIPYGWQPVHVAPPDLCYTLQGVPTHSAAGSGAPQYSLFAGTDLLIRSADQSSVLHSFASHAQLMTAQYARNFIFVHAGVVEWQGQAILIPGHSWSGKSSLVAALVWCGADYFSDEFALLDARGWVHPYALALSRRDANGGSTKIPAHELGAPGTVPVPVGLILMTQYRRKARWQPRALSPAQGVLALMAHTVAAQYAPARVMPVLRETVMRAAVFETGRGESDRVAPRVLKLLAA